MLWIGMWIAIGLIVGVLASQVVYFSISGNSKTNGVRPIERLIRSHLHPLGVDEIQILERKFPFRMRADLQTVFDAGFSKDVKVTFFTSVQNEHSHEAITLSECLRENHHNPVVTVPPVYEEINVGEDQPKRVITTGLWLIESNGRRMVVLATPHVTYRDPPTVQIQIAADKSPESNAFVDAFFHALAQAVATAGSYRGKILSLEGNDNPYFGQTVGILVHKLQHIDRDKVILPEKTLQLLERNVINFVKNRDRLRELGMPTKKGLLFYGPPGTGKTHTIHYLTRELKGHTTLLITADQVGVLGEYMTLARLLQPSIVVIEDVDLIARDRKDMSSPCEEVLLNKLLNEMDGLKEAGDILFVLTTNRPESLEAALASRPGRIDQAIEFPLPDDVGRKKLIELYAPRGGLKADLVGEIVVRTQGVSAAFIKELMRRTVQFALERTPEGTIDNVDVYDALDEMLTAGGSFNLRILGAAENAQTVCG